jgi:uroporphyrinogen-III synthase/uroporphyrinogen III methyltransferase/synthase
MKRDTLTGKRILVTRAVRQAGKLSDALRELGATPVEVPVLEIQPAEDFAPLEKAIRQLDSYDWLIFTSANAVSILAFNASLEGYSIHNSPNLKIAAIGRATAEAVERAHLKVDLVPEDYVAESLVDAFLKRHEVSGHDFSRAKSAAKKEGALAPEGNLAGQRILIARAAIARDVIPDALRAAGAHVDVVDAYRNVMPQAAPALLRAALEQGIDAATFTSSSSVTHLADAAKAAGLAFPFSGVSAISIGPITSQTLREYNWEPAAEASPSDIPGLVEALARYFRTV